jgi:hypothetical protein
VGYGRSLTQKTRRVTKQIPSRRVLERLTIDGDSPVGERGLSLWADVPSTAGHVKSCRNPGGPPSKAKYSLVTDSEPVP